MSGELSKKLKGVREKNFLSQTRFGMKIGVSGKTVSAYENGRSVPSLKVLDNISKVYKVHVINNDSKIDERLRNIQKEFEELKTLLTF